MTQSITELRVMRAKLKQELAKVTQQIQEIERADLRSRFRRFPPHQYRVMAIYAEQSGVIDGFNCLSFDYLVTHTGLNRNQVRRAVRNLARLGFLEFYQSTWTEDGQTCGAAYGLTQVGLVTFLRLQTEHRHETGTT